MALRLDGRRYSPAVTERIVAVGGASTSFAIGSKMLLLLMDLQVSARTINATTALIGSELEQQRNAVPTERLADGLAALLQLPLCFLVIA